MKQKPKKSQCPESSEYSTYQTGSTTPPKQHSALVAVLLVLVIFLAGLCSILGLINIKMFTVFYEDQQEEIPVSLDDSSDLLEQEASMTTGEEKMLIGIAGEPVSPVYQRHFQLPEGLFITYVEKGTSAYDQGIREGDVLIRLGEMKITEESHIQSFLKGRALGETYQAVIYRRDTDSQITLQLTVEQIT